MTAAQRTRGFKHAACGRCGGDAFLDLGEPEWRWLLCGKSLAPYITAQSDAWNATDSTVREPKGPSHVAVR